MTHGDWIQLLTKIINTIIASPDYQIWLKRQKKKQDKKLKISYDHYDTIFSEENILKKRAWKVRNNAYANAYHKANRERLKLEKSSSSVILPSERLLQPTS